MRSALFAASFLSCSGCLWLRPNCSKAFSIYRHPIASHESGMPLTKGVYVSRNDGGAFFLYADGRVSFFSSLEPRGEYFWSNPAKGFQEITRDWRYTTKEGWGAYRIIGDSLFSETFRYTADEWCKRTITRRSGIVLSDSSIVINRVVYHDGTVIFSGANIFDLYTTFEKPDSTLAWCARKAWYRKGLHLSRRTGERK